MVGDVCGVDWLGERLMLVADNSAASAGGPRSSCGGGDGGGDHPAAVLLLDCRPPADYQAEHIAGAVHLAVPTLMLRRLATGSLPVSSVVSCLQVYQLGRVRPVWARGRCRNKPTSFPGRVL